MPAQTTGGAVVVVVQPGRVSPPAVAAANVRNCRRDGLLEFDVKASLTTRVIIIASVGTDRWRRTEIVSAGYRCPRNPSAEMLGGSPAAPAYLACWGGGTMIEMNTSETLCWG